MPNGEQEAKKICYEFLNAYSSRDWGRLESLLADEFSAWIPQRKETIENAGLYIDSLKSRSRIPAYQVYNTVVQYDVWDKNHTIAMQLCEMDPGTQRPTQNFSILFLQVDREGTIESVTEFACPGVK